MVLKVLKLVAYYRVSTDKQQRSGLGLKAQQECVRRYAEANGGEIVLIARQKSNVRTARGLLPSGLCEPQAHLLNWSDADVWVVPQQR